MEVRGSNYVTTICRTPDGSMWVGADGDGIYRISPDGKSSTHLSGVPHSPITLRYDGEGKLWVGSANDGLGYIDIFSGGYHGGAGPADSEGKTIGSVYDVAVDKHGTLWVATMGHGLWRKKKGESKWEECRYVNKNYTLWMDALLYDANADALYVGTYYETLKIDRLDKEPKAGVLNKEGIVHAMTIDPHGTLWTATSEGVFAIGPDGRKRHYSEAEGLGSHTAYSIECDGAGNIWVATNNGLCRISGNEVRRFGTAEGAGIFEYGKNASWADADGTLWFGGTEGITFSVPTPPAAKGGPAMPKSPTFWPEADP